MRSKRIELFQGSGFTGTNYRMVITESFDLGTGLGSKEDEAKALDKASEILRELGYDVSVKNCQFTWDGTL